MISNSNESMFLSISKITIEKLFGLYNYELPLKTSQVIDFSKVFIFYGDNGSGKTTILQILYHLLSPIPAQNHKTFVARIPFKKFDIEFIDGTRIIAQRSGDNLIGSYEMLLTRNDKNLEIELVADEKNIIKISENPILKDVNQFLNELNLTLYFLSDSREFKSNIFEEEEREPDEIEFYIRKQRYEEIDLLKVSPPKDRRGFILILAIRRAVLWIMKKINEVRRTSELNVNKIYSDIIKSIANESEVEERDINTLKDTLNDLSILSKNYSQYEILSPLDITEIIDSIEKTPNKALYLVKEILSPYIEGLQAKIDALKEVYEILDILIKNLNDFFYNKTIKFEFNKGFVIRVGQVDLSPSMLSSGEKQLLMLFCNTILARESVSIFLIDEPEISLNVKWQRNLINALLELTKNSQVQFIIATHSIELITKYDANVTQLIPSK